MNLCSDGHDEVCYEGRTCPACYHISEKNSEIEDLNRRLDEKDNRISELENRVEELESKE